MTNANAQRVGHLSIPSILSILVPEVLREAAP
jgi:hypothetical protein